MELFSFSPNLAGASQANGAILRLLRTLFDVNELCFKCIRGVVSGLRAKPALNPTNNPPIHLKHNSFPSNVALLYRMKQTVKNDLA